MYNLIGKNALDSLYLYFEGINEIKIQESEIVKNAHDMNELSTNLFYNKKTEALLTLSQLTMFGWMQLNVYDLYQISYQELYGASSTEQMCNKFHLFSRQDAIDGGLKDADIDVLSDYNKKLSVLLNTLMVFEAKYSDLYLHLDYLYKKHGKDFLGWIKNYVEHNYFKPSGYLYMSIISEHAGGELDMHHYINEHGFTPLSYVQYQLNSRSQH